MGAPEKPCRLCRWFKRGRTTMERVWIRQYGSCYHAGKIEPTHANQKGCQHWVERTGHSQEVREENP